jgi:hypothetical protein
MPTAIGEDGDHVDVFIGPNKESHHVFIMRQQNPQTMMYDEDKVMLGFNSMEEAIAAYQRHYDKPEFLGDVEYMPFPEFERKIKTLEKGRIEKALERKGFSKEFTCGVDGRQVIIWTKSSVRTENILQKADLIPKRVFVTRAGKTFQQTIWVKPEEFKKEDTQQKKVESKPLDAPIGPKKHEVLILSKGIDISEQLRGTGIEFGKTPKVFSEAEVNTDMALIMPPGILQKAMEKHGLTKDQLLKAQESIHDPVAILKSSKHENRVVIVTDVLDDEDRPVIIAIVPGSDFHGRETNVIVSAYGRERFSTYMEANKGLLFYYNQKKIDGMDQGARKQYPRALSVPSGVKYITGGTSVKKSFRYAIPK